MCVLFLGIDDNTEQKRDPSRGGAEEGFQPTVKTFVRLTTPAPQ